MHVSGFGFHRNSRVYARTNATSSIPSGICFLLEHVKEEIYKLSASPGQVSDFEGPFEIEPQNLSSQELFPMLLCNVGSGCSLVKVWASAASC